MADSTPVLDATADLGGGSVPQTLRAGWKSVMLVCKACEKRSKGPTKISARQLAKSLERAAGDAKLPRPRVVMTSCLKACPKKAFTVAALAPGGGVEMIAFRRGDDPHAAVATLFHSNSTSGTPSPT